MSRFHYPRKLTAEERAKPEMNHFGPLPEGSNVEMCKSFFEQLEHCEEKYVDRENVYCASVLEFFLLHIPRVPVPSLISLTFKISPPPECFR